MADLDATGSRAAIVKAIRDLRDEQWKALETPTSIGERAQAMGAIGAYAKVLTVMGVDPDE